jgi:virginiamycin A acetyltransferase
LKTIIIKFVKFTFNSISLIIIFPLFILYRLTGAGSEKDGTFWGFSQFLSLFPGKSGNYLRKAFYRLSLKQCDKECAILFGTIFSQKDTEIGRGVYIGPNCNIGMCRIENNCTIGSNVHIMSGKHQHSFKDLIIPIQEQGGVYEKIAIGEDTWIGNCAIIMANVGKKCIIGAGSVVTNDIEEYSIVVGNPGKVIRKRI